MFSVKKKLLVMKAIVRELGNENGIIIFHHKHTNFAIIQTIRRCGYYVDSLKSNTNSSHNLLYGKLVGGTIFT